MATLEKDQKSIAAETKDIEAQIAQLEREMQDMEDSEVLMDAVTNELSMQLVAFDNIDEEEKEAQMRKEEEARV